MKTQPKTLRTHVIALLFILFQFIQFIPSNLVSSLAVSAEPSHSITLFSNETGSGKANWSLSEDGKQVTWDVTITQNGRETEASPSVEMVLPKDIGAPKLVSATPNGTFKKVDSRYIFNPHTYTTSPQTLTLKFTTSVNDLTSKNLSFKLGASIQDEVTPIKTTFKSLSIPNKRAQLEAERLAIIKAEEEKAKQEEAKKLAEQKAEKQRLDEEEKAKKEAAKLEEEKKAEKAAQEDLEKKAEEQRLAEEEKAKKEAAKLEEKKKTEKAAQEEKGKNNDEQPSNDKEKKNTNKEKADPETDKADEEANQEEQNKNNDEQPSNDKEKENNDKEKAESEADKNDEEADRDEQDGNNDEQPSDNKEKVDKEEVDLEVKEESDPGDMLDGFPATKHPNNFTPIKRFAPGSLGAATALLRGSKSLKTFTTSDLEPGEIRTSKTAKPVDGMVNTWDITVRIEGRDAQEIETTDVVLVIDRSGSMADNNRMSNAKSAANNFINTMIPQDPNLRIAVVSFSSEYDGADLVEVNSPFTENTGTLNSAVNGLNALGGTHTQAGIIQGQQLLDGSNADNRYMILLSNGQPTYSYEPINWTTGRPSWGDPGNRQANKQRTGVYDGNFNTGSVVGTGSDLTDSYNDSILRRHVHNGLAAIKTGQDARAGFDGLFTIAVEAGSIGTNILNDISSPGLSYSTNNPADLQEIYDKIGTQIATQHALQNVELTDEMGDGFSLINGSLATTEGSTTLTPENPNNETITWTIDPAVENLVAGTTDVRYAEMTYRVEINDDILALNGAKTNEDKLFDTNKVTQLDYTDTEDQRQTVDITSPKVDPVLLKIRKILENVEVDDRQFVVTISDEHSNFNSDESLAPNGGYIWNTDLRYEGTYNVAETDITGNGNTDLNQFIISYDVDGENKTSFEVNHINGKPRGDVTISVTNQEITLTDLNARKIWEGGPETDHTAVDLTLTRSIDGSTFETVDSDPTISPASGTSNQFDYTWTDLPEIDNDGNLYEYAVEEIDVIEHYDSSIIFDEEAELFIVTNTYVIPPLDIVGTKSWLNDTESHRPDTLSLSLYRTIPEGESELVMSTTTSAVDEWFYDFGEQDKTDANGNVYTYFIEEADYPNYITEYTAPYYVDGVLNLDIENTLVMGDLYIMKTDMDGNPILDNPAEFKLTRTEPSNGYPFTDILATDAEGKLVFSDLLAGTYLLEEIKAPVGFNLYPDDFVITVLKGENGETIVRVENNLITEENPLIIKNKPSQSLPDTGSMGTTLFSILGISLMGGALYGLNKKKRKQS